MLTLYLKAIARAQNPFTGGGGGRGAGGFCSHQETMKYLIVSCSHITHRNGDFGAISATERLLHRADLESGASHTG